MDDPPGLDQGQGFEQLVEGPEATGEDHEGLRVLDEHHLADEEVVELDSQVDVLVEGLLEGQLDVAPDRKPPSFAGAAVGRLHDAGSASGDDGEAAPGQQRAQPSRLGVHGIGVGDPGRAEDADGAPDPGQGIEPLHELGHDPQHPPLVGAQRVVDGSRLQQSPVGCLARRSAADQEAPGPPAIPLPHPTAPASRPRVIPRRPGHRSPARHR